MKNSNPSLISPRLYVAFEVIDEDVSTRVHEQRFVAPTHDRQDVARARKVLTNPFALLSRYVGVIRPRASRQDDRVQPRYLIKELLGAGALRHIPEICRVRIYCRPHVIIQHRSVVDAEQCREMCVEVSHDAIKVEINSRSRLGFGDVGIPCHAAVSGEEKLSLLRLNSSFLAGPRGL